MTMVMTTRIMIPIMIILRINKREERKDKQIKTRRRRDIIIKNTKKRDNKKTKKRITKN